MEVLINWTVYQLQSGQLSMQSC